MENRYGVRVGDDGRWHAKYSNLGDARVHAARLSKENWSGKGQIVDFETGDRETWRDGSKSGKGIS